MYHIILVHGTLYDSNTLTIPLQSSLFNKISHCSPQGSVRYKVRKNLALEHPFQKSPTEF